LYLSLPKLEDEIGKFVSRYGFDLVDFQVSSVSPRGRSYRVFLDKLDTTKITIDDCVSVSLPLKMFLASLGVFDDNSKLEVSSPGLDRVLKRDKDLSRFTGSNIRVSFKDNGKKKTVVGKLDSFDAERINLAFDGGTGISAIGIARSDVIEVRLVADV